MDPFQQGSFAQLEKNEHIEEMHAAEYQDDGPYLDAKRFYQLAYLRNIIRNSERIYGIADVHEIEPYEQQVVDGIRQFLVTMEDVDKKDLSVAEQCTGHPDGEDKRKDEIDEVADEDVRHKREFYSDKFGLYFLNFQ